MQFNVITALLFTMAAGVIAASPNAVKDSIARVVEARRKISLLTCSAFYRVKSAGVMALCEAKTGPPMGEMYFWFDEICTSLLEF
ncbi:uncharacterized protein RAG0_13453 [Rhynchosporium agropyri]|uniref:Fungal calcium binding protein domain-containing protein n=1 Tax=Rhynchosporium agropyri TaxID=914238 RepID=A0A1E1LD50_9HELO|nr:uncharacterized protein RAG0_13453 [Rhynchosporium agropyri]